MKAAIALCVLFVGAYCAPMFDDQLGSSWALFKRVHEKQYNSVEEETARYVIIFISHNLEIIFSFHLQSNYLGR